MVRNIKTPKWSKIFSVFLFVLLLGSYINIFALGEPYSPGTMLDPSCAPTDPNCIVSLNFISDGNTGWDNSYGFITSYTETDPVFSAYTFSGSGTQLALTNSPVFTTPSLGQASAASINNLPLSQDNTDFNVKVGQDAGLNLVNGAQHNTFLGYEAGHSALSGGTNEADSNTAIGYQSLYSNTTGSWNTANGYSSLLSNTTGSNNTANGASSLYLNTIGSNNTANGFYSLAYNTTGSQNTANGSNSLYYNTTGSQNIANGTGSLYLNTTGSQNTANGYSSLYSNKTGSNGVALGYESQRYANNTLTPWTNYNTSVGYQSLMGSTTAANNTGIANTALGYQSLYSNTTGYENTANGVSSLYSNTTGYMNTSLGKQSLYFNTMGNQNVSSGYKSLYTNSTGSNNVSSGYYSLYSNISGGYNVASGSESLYSNSTGANNTAIGASSLYYNTTGTRNTATGYSSLSYNTTGGYNTAVGFYSGRWITNGSTPNATSNNSLYLGYDTRASADGNTNEIVIGASAIGNGSNTATIGNSSLLRTYLTGVNLKAGSATAGTAPLKFTSGTNLSTTEAGAIEYDGTHLYFTATNGGTRYQLDQQGGGITVGTTAITSGTSGRVLYDNSGVVGEMTTSGTGTELALTNSPSFTTPSLGVATATSINNLPLSQNNTDFNVKVGQDAGGLLVVGARYNTFIGYEAGRSGVMGTNSADYNTAIGYRSFNDNETGNHNSSLGFWSLGGNTSGIYNMASGYQSGLYILDGLTHNTTGDYNVFIGADTKALTDNDQNEIVIGYNTIGNGSNTTTIGTGNVLYIGGASITGKVARFTNSAGYCDIDPLSASLTCSSDINLKKNITTLNGEEFILDENIIYENKTTLEKLISLNPVIYNWNTEEDGNSKHIGLIAQEVEQLFPDLVFTDSNTNLKSIAYSNLIPYTIQAIQEMNLIVKDLSSLDTESSTSLGSLIKSFLEDASNGIELVFFGEIQTNKITTEEVCIKKSDGTDFCINGDQLEEVVNQMGGGIVTPPSATPILNQGAEDELAPPLNDEEEVGSGDALIGTENNNSNIETTIEPVISQQSEESSSEVTIESTPTP